MRGFWSSGSTLHTESNDPAVQIDPGGIPIVVGDAQQVYVVAEWTIQIDSAVRGTAAPVVARFALLFPRCFEHCRIARDERPAQRNSGLHEHRAQLVE